jgi:exopolysaccharide biosynthesis WecB/TagA/CpsF family protein
MSIVLELDNQDLKQFVRTAAHYGTDRYGYVVTPNADHLIRYYDDSSFRNTYADAEYVLSDSRFLSYLLAITKRLRIPVCPGSDLTAELVANVAQPDDRLVLVGGSTAQAAALAQKFGLANLRHINQPMGFINDPAAVENVLGFIEQHSPFRFCLLAVGSPRQEIIAQRLKQRGIARGLALCIGASIDFLTGQERRAPRVLQQLGLEWAFRLLQNPRRLAGRYLVRGPRVFNVIRHVAIRLKHAPAQAPVERAAALRPSPIQRSQPPAGNTR